MNGPRPQEQGRQASERPRVLILQRRLPDYRVAFFERLRGRLASAGVDLDLVYGTAAPDEVSRGDAGHLEWGAKVETRYLEAAGLRLAAQRIPVALARRAAMVIVPHESAYLPGYGFMVRRCFSSQRFAFWGHGVENSVAIRSRYKRLTTRFPDWWFAYTSLSAERVASAGFPRDRITCVDNSVDTTETLANLGYVDESARASLRRDLGISGDNVAVFLGSLTVERRIEFLVNACDLVRERLADFHLVVIGDGPMREVLRGIQRSRPWLHLAGALHGREKAQYCSLGKLMLNPGMVGLNIVDAFAIGTPMVTTRDSHHSPEIAYLEHGENGLFAGPSPQQYASTIVSCLNDVRLLNHLREGCFRSAARYTIDNMSRAFTSGILSALNAPRRSARRAHAPEAKRAANAVSSQSPVQVAARTMCRPRVLVFHPALAPYRLDFFNALARYCELRVAFLHADAIEQPFNQQLLRGSLRVDNRILANGFTFMGRTVRFGLDREIGEFLPDAVVTAEYSPTTLEIAIKRRLLQRPYAHIVWTDDNPASVSEDVALRKVARALTLRMADGVLVVSDETAAMYRDKFHNALDTGVVPIIQSESVFRARLKHAVPVATRHVERHGLQGRRVLLFVGRLAPVKRVDRLLRAFARVRRRVTDATLVIVGDGTDSAALRALAQSLEIEACVVFAGRHEGVALAAWYLIGGLFALPSEYEPFGAVVNEALLAGIPVVCSGQAGARALVVEGQNGTVIDWSRDEVVDEALGEWLSRIPPLRDVPLQVGRSSLMRARLEDAVQTFVRVVESACQRIGRL